MYQKKKILFHLNMKVGWPLMKHTMPSLTSLFKNRDEEWKWSLLPIWRIDWARVINPSDPLYAPMLFCAKKIIYPFLPPCLLSIPAQLITEGNGPSDGNATNRQHFLGGNNIHFQIAKAELPFLKKPFDHLSLDLSLGRVLVVFGLGIRRGRSCWYLLPLHGGRPHNSLLAALLRQKPKLCGIKLPLLFFNSIVKHFKGWKTIKFSL